MDSTKGKSLKASTGEDIPHGHPSTAVAVFCVEMTGLLSSLHGIPPWSSLSFFPPAQIPEFGHSECLRSQTGPALRQVIVYARSLVLSYTPSLLCLS